MSPPTVAFFCMPDRGHFQRLRPIIAGVSRLGAVAHVFTHASFGGEIEEAGGSFADLFAYGTVEEADDESWPFTVRFIPFAARVADDLARDVAALGTSLIVYDTFAVVARAVANRLGLPRVNVCAGHNVVPGRFVTLMEAHPRARVSERCRRAVDVLRTRFGMDDASPFSYASGMSPDLNVYCEPPAFLDEADRQAFEPVVFFGSLPAAEDLDGPPAGRRYFPDDASRLKVYASFGTVVWSYREAEAMRAIRTFIEAVREDEALVVGLGGVDGWKARARALARPGVSVERYVDQWRLLREADVFLTHHGLNSTHEAIFRRVPMISYPFVWDQPGLAATCQRLGLAVPLVSEPMAPVAATDARAALDAVVRGRGAMHAALAVASAWEREVVAARPAVLQRILALAGSRSVAY